MTLSPLPRNHFIQSKLLPYCRGQRVGLPGYLWRSDRKFGILFGRQRLPDWIIASRVRIWFHSSFASFWRRVRRLMSGGNASLSGSATKQEYYHAFLCNNSQDKTRILGK